MWFRERPFEGDPRIARLTDELERVKRQRFVAIMVALVTLPTSVVLLIHVLTTKSVEMTPAPARSPIIASAAPVVSPAPAATNPEVPAPSPPPPVTRPEAPAVAPIVPLPPTPSEDEPVEAESAEAPLKARPLITPQQIRDAEYQRALAEYEQAMAEYEEAKRLESIARSNKVLNALVQEQEAKIKEARDRNAKEMAEQEAKARERQLEEDKQKALKAKTKR